MDRFSEPPKPSKMTPYGRRIIRRDKTGQRYVIAGGNKVLLPTKPTIMTPVGKRSLRDDGTVKVSGEHYYVVDGKLVPKYI